MTTTSEHEQRWSDDLAAYALGALEPVEASELEVHLESCERCRSELRWLGPALQMLPEDVERVEPPRQLRDRVMAEVRADVDSGRERTAARGFRRSSGPLEWLRGGGGRGWRPLAAGLAALALVLVAFAGYEIGGGGGGGQDPTISAQQESGVFAEVVRAGDGGTLRLANVERLPSDRVLEAWVEREGEIEAVPALFVPNREGEASTPIDDLDGVETVMVTREPEGGSEAPTSSPIVSLPIPG